MELNEIVRRVRESKNLTQENLADEIGVHVTTIIRYETNGSTIPIDKLEKIAKALQTTVGDFYAYKDNPSLLEEPLMAYRSTKTHVNVMVELDGTPDTLNLWMARLKKLNAALT